MSSKSQQRSETAAQEVLATMKHQRGILDSDVPDDAPAAQEEAKAPLPIRLHCPMCQTLHLDEGEFATKSHHTHSCQQCGHTWRPAVDPTVGVRFLPGFKNEAPQTVVEQTTLLQAAYTDIVKAIVDEGGWMPTLHLTGDSRRIFEEEFSLARRTFDEECRLAEKKRLEQEQAHLAPIAVDPQVRIAELEKKLADLQGDFESLEEDAAAIVRTYEEPNVDMDDLVAVIETLKENGLKPNWWVQGKTVTPPAPGLRRPIKKVTRVVRQEIGLPEDE